MLKDTLYVLNELDQREGGAYWAKIALEPTHPIFQGHFPGQPVLPGVCLLEMVKELLGQICGKSCRLLRADSIKFMKVVDPTLDPYLTFEIAIIPQAAELKINASSYLGDGSANFKLKASFV